MSFEEASAQFLEWFCSQPGTSFHDDLKLTDFRERGAGRGIIATRPIPAGTDLFAIPRSAIISTETSELAQKLPDLFTNNSNQDISSEDGDEDAESISELPISWLNLILAVLYEVLHSDTSKWSSYLSVLPLKSSSFNTLMYWNDEDLSRLQGSAIVSKIGRDSADKMFQDRILPIIAKHADVFYPASANHLTEAALLEKCHVVGSLIMSYAFDLQPDDDDDEEDGEDGWVEDSIKTSTMGMVPMADMLNADAEFNAHLSHGDDALTMTSLRDIQAGEEVLNYYGPLPNAELLRRYGYTSPKHSRYDIVEISWPLVKAVLSQASSAQEEDAGKASRILSILEEEADLDDSEAFILERETGDPNEEGLCTTDAKFTKFPDELVDIVTEFVKKMTQEDVKKRKLTEDANTTMLKLQTLDCLKEIVMSRQAHYLALDPQNPRNSGGLGNRVSMADDVVVGEKTLLEEAYQWVLRTKQKYDRDDHATSSGNPPKKHKK